MPDAEIPQSTRGFIARYIRSVEQLETLLLVTRQPDAAWSVQKVYDIILSTLQSVERRLDELVRDGLLEKTSEPAVTYRPSADESLQAEVARLDQLYKATPVRIIEAIYKRDVAAAQSFADAFKIKKPEQP